MMTGQTPTYIGCLRNANAVARAVLRHGNRIAVIPAGERWEDGKSTRFALEDCIGAGAVIHNLEGTLSPEAQTAMTVFDSQKANLRPIFKNSVSGKELTAKGFAVDVAHASELDCDDVAPVLRDGAYVDAVTLQNESDNSGHTT